MQQFLRAAEFRFTVSANVAAEQPAKLVDRLIRTSPAGNCARISIFPPIASTAFRSVLKKISERLSIFDTPA
jgi:hypothetical protein